MTIQELVQSILKGVGGRQNVITATNCMTRLRISVKDDSASGLLCASGNIVISGSGSSLANSFSSSGENIGISSFSATSCCPVSKGCRLT